MEVCLNSGNFQLSLQGNVYTTVTRNLRES